MTTHKNTLFRGTFTALITPFSDDGSSILPDRLAEHVHYQAEGGVAGVVPCGTTGESPTLSDEEHRHAVERTIEAAKPLGLSVIAGAGSNNTEHACELHRFTCEAGADATLQVCPYYNKPSQEGLHRHFMTIADSAELPICLYNIPGRTGVALSIETIERLSRHPNIQAIKEASGSLDLASEISARTNLALLSGDDSLTLPMASVGGVGVVSVISNLLPRKVAELCEAFLSNRWDSARQRHVELLPLARGLLGLETNPVPVKAAMAIVGRDSGAVRLPLVRASQATINAITRLLEAAGIQPATVTV